MVSISCKTFTGLFAIAFLLITACDDGDGDVDSIPDPVLTSCVLVRITEGTMVTEFTYDTQGYVTSVNENDGANTSHKGTVYTYNESRQLTRLDYYYDNYPNIMFTHTVYSYTNGLLSKAQHYYGDANPVFEESFSYDSNNRIEKITDSNGNTTTFSYDNAGNITEVITEGDEKIKVVFENYDNRNKPFSVANGYLNIPKSSVNNPGYSTTYHEVDGVAKVITNSAFRYDYNTLGLPTRIEEHQDNGFGLVKITNYSYACK